MTKALLGSSKQAVRSVNRILQRRNNPAFLADRDGAEPIPLWAKDMDGVKTLELQPLGTVRRKGIGTFAQPSTQEEIRLRTGVRWPRALPACGAR